jgi:hypothetical protein
MTGSLEQKFIPGLVLTRCVSHEVNNRIVFRCGSNMVNELRIVRIPANVMTLTDVRIAIASRRHIYLVIVPEKFGSKVDPHRACSA